MPQLIVPPTINKYYALDLAPGRSMAEYLVQHGQQVFVISRRNPDARHAGWGLDSYIQEVLGALDAVQRVTGADRAALMGACAGGIIASMTAAHLAAIVAAMDSQRGVDGGDLPAEERRRVALIAFIGAGSPSPPSTALMVAALADARRTVAMHQARGLAVDQWLAGEVRLRGIRENVAVLAVLEMPGRRAEIAGAYRQQHPDRAGALNDLLAVLD